MSNFYPVPGISQIASKQRTQYMHNKLKNSLRFIQHRSMQKVIYYNVNKEKGISPDVDSFTHTLQGFLQGHAQRTNPTKETLSNRSSRT